jgi:hypothetical protein
MCGIRQEGDHKRIDIGIVACRHLNRQDIVRCERVVDVGLVEM